MREYFYSPNVNSVDGTVVFRVDEVGVKWRRTIFWVCMESGLVGVYEEVAI